MSQILQPTPVATPTPAPTDTLFIPTGDPASALVTPPPSPSESNSTISSNVPTPVPASQNHTEPSIPINSPAGGILMTKPPQTAVSFYKIAPNEIVTFGWNFTSILQDSQKLTVSAICQNGNTYAVGPTDGIISGTATEVVWDLYSYQVSNPGQPLAQGTYTLTMWDERGQHALPKPGLMQPFNSLRFGLYTPQPYYPLDSGE